MRVSKDNPSRNTLPPGITESGFADAIDASGYPLQGEVAHRLLKQFHVAEEWGFVDADTKEHRSLDIFAFRWLVERTNTARIRPRGALLVECKRSRHPYVFFQSTGAVPPPDFPRIRGFSRPRLRLFASSGASFMEVSFANALGLRSHAFIANGPSVCATFARATPDAKKVELSGADPFNSLILPLTKALDYAESRIPLAESQQATLYPMLHLAVSVLDAPMALVESPDKTRDPIFTPWVRVVRQEAPREKDLGGPRWNVVDVVHSDFLEHYVEGHVLPFLADFAARVEQTGDALVRDAHVANLENWTWDEIRPRR